MRDIQHYWLDEHHEAGEKDIENFPHSWPEVSHLEEYAKNHKGDVFRGCYDLTA